MVLVQQRRQAAAGDIWGAPGSAGSLIEGFSRRRPMPGLAADDGSGSAPAPGACISSADTAWVLLSFVLVLSMFAGLALFEASLLQAKNTVSIRYYTSNPPDA